MRYTTSWASLMSWGANFPQKYHTNMQRLIQSYLWLTEQNRVYSARSTAFSTRSSRLRRNAKNSSRRSIFTSRRKSAVISQSVLTRFDRTAPISTRSHRPSPIFTSLSVSTQWIDIVFHFFYTSRLRNELMVIIADDAEDFNKNTENMYFYQASY